MSELDTTSFRNAASRLRDVPELVDDMAEDAVDDIGRAALENVRRRRRRHRVTGKGERLVRLDATGSGDTRRVTVHAAGRVAHLITGGTRPHTIRPIRGRAIRMPGSTRGFASAVRHPGTAADPFVARGLDDTRDEIRTITADAGDELAADVARKIGRR